MKHDRDSHLIDVYIDQRFRDPSASPPAELDAETVRMLDALIYHGAESFREALSYFPAQTAYKLDTASHLRLLEEAASSLGAV